MLLKIRFEEIDNEMMMMEVRRWRFYRERRRGVVVGHVELKMEMEMSTHGQTAEKRKKILCCVNSRLEQSRYNLQSII